MATAIVNTFDGGMTNDPRDRASNVARISKHIDNDNRAHVLTPHPDNTFTSSGACADANTAADYDSFRIQQFLYANSLFYGLGVEDGTTKPKIFEKSSVTGAWGASTNGTHASSVALGTGPKIFILYQNYLYGQDNVAGSRTWWKYGDITNSPTFTRGINTNLNVISPIVHPKDDIMYFGYGAGTAVSNRIGKNNSGTFTDSVLVFQLYAQVASLTDYNNYLAIGVNNPDNSTVIYLWDRDSTLATLSEKIDNGTGTIKWIENIGGVLVSCSVLQPTAGLSLNPTVVFKYYDGARMVEFQRFTCSLATIYEFKQRYNNTVYFMAEMTINSVSMKGIWKVVRSPLGRLSVSFDRLPRIDDDVTAGGLFGFLRTGDYFHISCLDKQNSDKYIVTKTCNAFTTTANYRTTVNPGMAEGDRSKKKQLTMVSITTEPLASGEAVNVFYRVDGGSWIGCAYSATDGDVTAEFAGSISVSGGVITALGPFTAGREYEFSIEPSGGAKVTELKYEYDVIKTLQ